MTEAKTDRPGIFKVKEGVLINKDNEALRSYKKRKMNMKRVEKMEQELSEIKSSMNEIKTLLQGLVK
jgi:prefoldin subunit 5